jgi:hypothetical protein
MMGALSDIRSPGYLQESVAAWLPKELTTLYFLPEGYSSERDLEILPV